MKRPQISANLLRKARHGESVVQWRTGTQEAHRPTFLLPFSQFAIVRTTDYRIIG